MLVPTAPQREAPQSELELFFAQLREKPHEVNPSDWRVNWNDAPWPITVRTGGERTPLSQSSSQPMLRQLGYFFSQTFAMTRLRADPQAGIPATPNGANARRHESPIIARRPIPSGGSMYPVEAYIVLPPAEQIYHYDPYRNDIISLFSDPNPQPPGSLSQPSTMSIYLSLRHWKNVYKYGAFSFRLGTVDAGVALGRAFRVGGEIFGGVRVIPEWRNRDIEERLAMDPRTEAIFVGLDFGPVSPSPSSADRAALRNSSNHHWPATKILERSQHIRQPPRFEAAQQAVRQALFDAPLAAVGNPTHEIPATKSRAIQLPRCIARELPANKLARRTSNGRLFSPEPIPLADLSEILFRTKFSLATLGRKAATTVDSELTLRCAIQRVLGIPPGWYEYQQRGEGHMLMQLGTGSNLPGEKLQQAMLADTINIELAAVTIHIAGQEFPWAKGRGPLGYWQQQLAVGAALDAVCHFSAGLGYGSHPLLGFAAHLIDDAYQDKSRVVLAQIPVGPVRTDHMLEVAVP
jgi:hypothetical protein